MKKCWKIIKENALTHSLLFNIVFSLNHLNEWVEKDSAIKDKPQETNEFNFDWNTIRLLCNRSKHFDRKDNDVPKEVQIGYGMGKYGEGEPSKIGITFYSKREFESGLFDSRIAYYLYMLKYGKLVLTYIANNLIIPDITYDEMMYKNKIFLSEKIHELKRLYISECNDYRKVYKKLLVLMKIVLLVNGIVANDSDDVFTRFSEFYGIEHRFFVKSANLKDCRGLMEYINDVLSSIGY